MAQNKIVITTTPPLPGTTLVSEANDALESLSTDFAGAIDPASVDGVGPYSTWADTANGVVKRRNSANTTWVTEYKLLLNNSSAQNIDFDGSSDDMVSVTVADAIIESLIQNGGNKTAIGTAVLNFDTIPSGAKRVTLNLLSVGTNSTSPLVVGLSNSGGIITTGYNGSCTSLQSAANPVSLANSTTFNLVATTSFWSSTITMSGSIVFTKGDGNNWYMTASLGRDGVGTNHISAGSVGVPGGLEAVRFSCADGTSLIDKGVIEISYEI